ncbi:capsid maturation protease and MuF-like fusion protein [Mycobacterium phage Waleliano]|uniref:Capsid maturation protease and MuF-like fusion protein n=6 Tax=Caudoviricetes TaxID=2731619 RepID=A0A345KWH2_9CAUD|nr:portal protein [Mycobacterium phage BrownCNA]YP_009614434.1 portal protein [Mycobacterium phage Zemanar]AXH47374.1 capsid maturation protease and MuF-like fusion protein [Mycobacterium phage Hangman]QBI96079.1 capsid maturation protease and MuF-like fusion protein [Mycobacterium phage Waleliano]QOC58570.1 capsid morphogenesis protein [Mycobacterium phage Lolalove]AEJ95685.1 capsid maturation protease and MuF-like fusion protein [Mycobacterium phage Zemanar]AKY02724.1 capsid maturation prot
MWPLPGEALNRTIEVEAGITDLYAEVLNTWCVQARAAVLPELATSENDVLTAAGSLPPEPGGIDETAGFWDQHSTELILAGMSNLYALSLVEGMEGMEIPLPDIDLTGRKAQVIPPAVMRSITSTSSVAEADIQRAADIVESVPELRQARDDFVAAQRPDVVAVPKVVQAKVQAAVSGVKFDAMQYDPMHTDDNVSVIEVYVTRQREAAAAVLTPGSPELRDVARNEGYQAAGIQNAAVVVAAAQSEDELEKVWIATIDGKTRHTHFAADGQRAPLAGKFTVGAALLDFPADPAGPAAEVKNCRCRVGILAPDEELPDEVDRHTERLAGRDSTARNRSGSQSDEVRRRAADGTIRARDDEDGIGRTASAAPSEQEYDMPREQVVNTEQGGSTVVLATDETEAETFRVFTDQPIAFVGIETSDGRMLAKDIEFSVRTPPLPMMWTKQTGYGHEDAFTVGVIESARVDGDTIRGSGYWLNTTEADEAFNEASHKVSRPSVDLARTEWKLTDEDGNEITEEQWWDMPIDAKVIQTITAAELIGTTMVATPAFGDTMIEFTGERESRDAALVASAAEAFRPRVYAASMFADPQLSGPTLPTMDPETGHMFGHLACFGACHRSIQSECVVAPRSRTGYSMFHTSPAVRLDDGTSLPVGRLTVGSGHAPDHVSGQVAAAHYDTAGTCFALVRVGEDKHGIWFSGVAAPWATPEQIEMGLSAPLSGDWRDFGQGLELVAALAVNTPGFAVRGREGDQGQPLALVASLGPNPRGAATRGGNALSANAIADIVSKAVTTALAQRDTDAELATLLAKADEKLGPMPTPNDEVAELLAEADAKAGA